jgi:hypothetical protein
VATAASGVYTFHHEGKSCPGWCEGVHAHPPSFTIVTITDKVAAEWADTLTLFHLYENMYSVFQLELTLARIWAAPPIVPAVTTVSFQLP